MKLRVYCSIDNSTILEVKKTTSFTQAEINTYKNNCGCSEHGRNTYIYEQLSQEVLDTDGQPFDPPRYEVWNGNVISSEEHILVEVTEEE